MNREKAIETIKEYTKKVGAGCFHEVLGKSDITFIGRDENVEIYISDVLDMNKFARLSLEEIEMGIGMDEVEEKEIEWIDLSDAQLEDIVSIINEKK